MSFLLRKKLDRKSVSLLNIQLNYAQMCFPGLGAVEQTWEVINSLEEVKCRAVKSNQQ